MSVTQVAWTHDQARTSETPRLVLERLHILNVYDQHIARLRSLDLEWTAQVVHFREINIPNVVCRVVVLDLATGPVYTLDLDGLAILDGSSSRDCECVQLLFEPRLADRF